MGQAGHRIMLPFHQSRLGALPLHTAQGTATTPLTPHTSIRDNGQTRNSGPGNAQGSF